MLVRTLLVCFAICLDGIAVGVARGGEEIDFRRDIRPILSENCFHCHGPDEATRQAGLRLDRADSAMTVIEPGDVQQSELLNRVMSDDADYVMPPPEARKLLSEAERRMLARWVSEGAAYQRHWAFIPPSDKYPPIIDSAGAQRSSPSARGAIDAFVLARLQREGWQPSPPASRETLIRRLSLDLTGLPPTPPEIREYLNDRSDDATERLIDRLLASPRYGEQMALGWLEGARYADTDGYQNDRYRYQHVWRDWVIEALNSKMPYDQFLIEQLAGDLLPGATLKQQVATGFGRNHRINSEDGSIPEEWRTENVVDRVDTMGTLLLGLTVGCARCHDHKYDPISQREYYQLFAYFNSIAEWGVGPNNGNSPPFIEVPNSWPDLSDQENRFQTPPPVELRNAREEAGNGLRRPQAGSPSTVMVMHELEQPRATYVLRRGQYDQPDEAQPVSPGVPAALQFDSGNQPRDRLELAHWLVDPDHPLTARVAVNRIWQHFFGVGLVETSENFGSQGSPPSHPELLDWLARELVRRDWDLTAIERLILSSATYQQSSRTTPELAARDPDNRLLARGPRQRLSAFALRDQALAAAGLLVERIGGPSAKPYMPPKIWSSISNNKYEQDHGANLYRRSVYTYWRRTIPPPTMMNFNAAAREVCVVRGERTDTPLQALTLMNNKTFVESSRFLAEQMMGSGRNDLRAQIDYGFRRVCGRSAIDRELEVLHDAYLVFLQSYQQQPAAADQLLSIGEAKRDATLPLAEHAAMTMTASLLLNLHEAITKP